MQCPSCGLQIDQQNIERCPRCGRMLSDPPAADSYGQGNASAPGNGYPQGGAYTPPQEPHYQPYPSYPLPAAEAPQPPAWQPSAANEAPPQPPEWQYGQPAPSTGYGQPAPPSGYGQQPYGAYAPPSYPLPPGYPQPRPPLAPLPERKPRTGRVVGIVALVVVVLAACTGGTIFAIHSLGQTTTTTLSGTPSTAASPTPNEVVIYGATFKSDDEGWLDDAEHCFLKSDGYHVTNTWACYAPIGTQTDVDISVTTQQVSGPTTWPYGIIFRRASVGNDYQFLIDSNGKWVFYKCVNDTCTALVDYTPNDVIRGGLNTPNSLEVRISGSHFDFFVNNTKVGSADDTTFTLGKVGLVAAQNVDSVFTNFIVSRPN